MSFVIILLRVLGEDQGIKQAIWTKSTGGMVVCVIVTSSVRRCHECCSSAVDGDSDFGLSAQFQQLLKRASALL
jgi:hypothetical protein